MKGSIKTLRNGYGFIIPEDGSNDVFFHVSDIAKDEEGQPLYSFDSLKEGDAVTFEMGTSDKGPKAVDVALAA